MNPHVLLFSFSKPYNEKIYQHILNSSFIHKLTYKYKKEILDSSECKHSIFRLDAHYSQTYLCAITK